MLRHKLLVGVLACVLVAWLVGAASGEGDPDTSPPAGTPDRIDPVEAPDRQPRAVARDRPRGKGARSDRLVQRTRLVHRVVDGDTFELGNGDVVRLVGIDTPESGQCGHERAAARLERLVLGRRVTLALSDEDTDGYGRLLRYVDVGSVDAGLRLVKEGLAVARFDSRDGYGFHPRQPRYVAADRGARNLRCAEPLGLLSQHGRGGGCASGYRPCVPLFPPDVDCAAVDGPITVTGPDPHALDADGDGDACE